MDVIGQAFLSFSVEMLLNKLNMETSGLLKFARQEEVYNEMMKWKTKLLKIRNVLEDAEEKQMTNRLVEIWLSELRDLAYDVEDILDEFETEALQRKLEEKPQAGTSKVRKLISPFCYGFSPKAVKFNVKMGSKIKVITTRLEEITRQKDVLNLGEIGGRRYNRASERLPSTSLVNKDKVYGREKDEEAIVELLLSGEASNDIVSVIPIVGMGGLGKTTLAQLVYNNARVTDSFDLKEWICVSEDFNVIEMTKTLLGSGSYDAKDLNLLQVRLKQKLTAKKFLIVLDDVWNVNYENWTVLCAPFEAGALGSRIIVTTRNQDVSSTVGTVQAYLLKHLSNDDCISLFSQHALGAKNFDAHPNLKDIGEAIIKRCNGLPLAAKVLGGLLRSKPNHDEWQGVLNSNIWDIPEEKCGILPALRLSYHHLPSHLKRCFAYCALFPKDYEFDEDELVLLWMAEGFLQQPYGKKQMKDIGHEYFRDLLSRSFFQQSSSAESQFVMHDLINDLAQSVSREICFNYDNKLQGNRLNTGVEKARHMSFTRHTYEVSERFKDFHTMNRLRTFIALPIHISFCAACCYLSNNVLLDSLPKLRCLRLLSLSGYCISELPPSIDGLKCLRYLNLSHTKIRRLPESVGSLFNLQTLILKGCTELTKLPQGIENLINLLCLNIADTYRLQEMSLRISNLKSLQSLSKFIVKKDNRFGIRELRDLNLQGKLSILGLHNVSDIQDARIANLMDKHGLNELLLEWSDDFNDSRNAEVEMLVLHLLHPHKNLKKLTVSFYGGIKFPSWIGDPLFANIVRLNLCKCRRSMSLPPLGKLPSLREVFIDGMDRVERMELEKGFPSLEKLRFENMLEWVDWICSTGANEEVEEFPRLCELTIRNCPKLTGKLPSRLPSLVKLIISHCPMLTDPLKSLPSLHELQIEGCNVVVLRSVVDLSSLTTLKIRSMSELMWIPERFVQLLGALKSLTVSDCTELTSLWQKGAGLQSIVCKCSINEGCSQSGSLAEIQRCSPHPVEDLILLNCDNPVKLPNGLHSLISLKYLQTKSCPKLVSFPETDFLSKLKHLVLRDCPSLKSLPCELMSNKCLLEDLEIEDCPSLISFPTGQLPHTLKSLKIQYCTNLQSLPEGIMHTDDISNISYLENLEIINCPSLPSFPPGKLPTGLKILKIGDCSLLEVRLERILPASTSLEYISIWNCLTMTSLPECQHSLTHLTELSLNNCPGLRSFPETGLHLPTLRRINICNCVNLKSLPVQMQDLTSLQDLIICGCPALVSFPKGGLPPNLTSLGIWDCENIREPMSEWNLHSLTSLRDFSIAGGCFLDTIFPDEKCLLPANLISIWIGRLHHLEFLSKGLRNLTSLEELEIVRCPKLRSLPKEGLPATLGRLSIKDCPLLRQQCSKEKGEYWPMIAHIPCIEIGDINTMK